MNEYNTEIKQVSTDQEILMAISRVVRNLEMLHPFPDGNGRTFVSILMNHLLLYNGFLAAILADPNIDIELSVKKNSISSLNIIYDFILSTAQPNN